MLQRNPHPYALDVPAIPATVQGGDTVDWPHPIAGFEAATPEPDEPTPADDEPTPEPARTPKTTAKRAAAPADNLKE